MEAKWVEIDLDALAHNMKEIRKKAGPDRLICAVVKSDGYGHGVPEIIDTLVEAGADQFAVAVLNEALELRRSVPDRDILVLGSMPEGTEEASIDAGLQHTVTAMWKAKALSDVAVKLGKTARVHIKLDTGMTRLGFQMTPDGVAEVVEISKLPGLDLEGIYTHFARADEIDKTWADAQYEKYQWFVAELEKQGITFRVKHASNSAAIMEMPETHNDMVRPGIILYGIYPSDEVDRSLLDIKPVMSFKTRITHLKTLPEERQISYGGRYVAPAGTVIGTVAVGYADGYTRAQSGKAEVLYKGQRAKVVGNICMDQCMIDLSAFPDVKVGDEIVLMGISGDDFISADEVGARYGTIGYEVVCAVNRRVPRYYIKDGNVVHKRDYLEDLDIRNGKTV
ncbi:MAG: alanine racemase [Firmicutes bacterium]|nr:alanine racemase [Bacillota bacterium]